MKIRSVSGISHQGEFAAGFTENLTDLAPDSHTVHPEYSSLISPMELRRMSSLQKMGMYNAMRIRQDIAQADFGGILIGTAIGCGQHTRNFIDKVLQAGGGLVSPTSFIVSTHNTLAGMIALASHCHHYNITYTHHALSLEHALLDARMLLAEGRRHVLVGASDENEETLHDLSKRTGTDIDRTTEGSWFFLLEPDGPGAEIADMDIRCGVTDIAEPVTAFLDRNNIRPEDLTGTLYAAFTPASRAFIHDRFAATDYTRYCGVYYTSSGFALGMAADMLRSRAGRILIINNLSADSLGLMLVKSD